MKTLFTVDEVSRLIQNGKILALAGSESLLRRLPKGNWIGGTIPYFMSERGGVLTHEEIQVTEFPAFVSSARARLYSSDELEQIPQDYDNDSVSICIIPAATDTAYKYAEDCTTWTGFFDRPIVGWIAGVDLKDLGQIKPKVFNGVTGEISDSKALVMHLNLPADKYGKVNIINLAKPGTGDTITFSQPGFEAKDCMVNGKKMVFADYLAERHVDTKLPLVANYLGTMVNVAFQSVDNTTKNVRFYAPVFTGIEYKLSAPIQDYAGQFEAEMKKLKKPTAFSCNCILNYLYAGLEGKKVGTSFGPMTFGEIAYMLLSQTMVYLTFEDK